MFYNGSPGLLKNYTNFYEEKQTKTSFAIINDCVLGTIYNCQHH